MYIYYITFRSVTFAQRAEKLLNKQGIRVGLIRTPRWMEEQGCGYALKIWNHDVLSVVKFLRDSSIQIRKVYVQREGGEMEEMRL